MSQIQDFLTFLNESPVPYLFTENIRKTLTNNGYVELSETDIWTDIPQKGFVIRGNRALVAFNIGGYDSAIIVGTHSDSPCLKIRDKPDFNSRNLKQVRVYTYGGALWYTWIGRDLRLVGSVIVRNKDETDKSKRLVQRNIDSVDPIAFIPNYTVELKTLSEDNAIRPIIGGKKSKSLIEYIAETLQVNEEDIVDWDLSFVDAQPPSALRKFITSERLDNLGSTFSAVQAFLQSKPNNTINCLAVFDNEEVGSDSRFGAMSDLLPYVLKKLIIDPSQYYPFIARSLLVSSDNCHAYHPNFSKQYDTLHSPLLGNGVVIKKAPGASYATDMTSSFAIKHASQKLKIPIQYFMNKNDIPAGSTIGPIVSTLMGISTVDIGQPMLGMHSIRETMHFKDVTYLTQLLTELYNNYLEHRLNL